MRNRSTNQIAAAKIAPIASDDKLGDFVTEVNILVDTKHVNITNFVAGYYFESMCYTETITAAFMCDVRFPN